MYIFGMSCAGCVASVKMALEDVPGVKHAAVDLEQCMAVVEYEAPATVEQLEMAEKKLVSLLKNKAYENSNY